MKKQAFSLFIPLIILVVAVFVVVPVSVNAQTATANLASQTPVPIPVTKNCYRFNTNLAVGSEGSDVVALQTFLIANGYGIPSISSGTKSKGYFDSETQLAVMKYQNTNGIPTTGFVGPLTRGALNSSCVNTGTSTATAQTVKCPDGYVCTPIGTPTTIKCPDGYVCYPISTGSSTASTTEKYDMPITSPTNTYETWTVGDGHIIRWTYPTELAGKTVKLNVALVNPQLTSSWLIFSGKLGVSINYPSGGEVVWKLLNNSNLVASGQYNILVTAYDASTGITHKGISGPMNVTGQNNISSSPTPVPPVTSSVNTFNGTLSASLVSSNEDQAGMWGVFGPGAGYVNTDKTDWGWQATLKIDNIGGKNIKSMTILSNNYGEGWSTSRDGADLGKQLYPLVIALNDKQVNVEYVDSLPLGQTNYTSVTYKLYGQKESSTWPGGKLIVRFSDGSQATVVIPASVYPNSTPVPTNAPLPTPTYSPTPSPLPVSAIGPTIKVNPAVISSGGSSKLSFTFPSNTTKAQLYFYCPSGVLTGASPEICNRYMDVTSNNDWTIMLYNFSPKPQYVVPNYYIYTSDNPGYGRGVSSQITVNPSSTSSTSPTPSPSSSPSAIIINDNNLNASIWSAVDDYFKGQR